MKSFKKANSYSIAFGLIWFFILFCSIISLPSQNLYSDSKSKNTQKLVAAAMHLTSDQVIYDPSYFRLQYPMGDVPADRGVCTDVIIRAYRKIGIDLQERVHVDMKKNFHLYPKNWGLKKPDSNIDHRRVPNLQVYFSRFGRVKRISNNSEDYTPGDIVTWDLGRGIPHIGIVVDRLSRDGKRNLIVHNVGAGQVMEDFLFRYKITGHYNYIH
jgi:uncharacterized protein